MSNLRSNRTNPKGSYNLASPEEIIDDARNGRMYILVDAEDRENEGDLIIPAQFATPDAINFMVKYGRGLVCLAIDNSKAEVLGLSNMSADNRSRFETAAAEENDTNKHGGGGGKRSKLNNGKRSLLKKKNSTPTHSSGGDDNEYNTPQPIMLLDEFLALMERCGFECTNMDRSNKMFLFMDFVKVDGSKGLSEKERFTAKPCIYKRR